MEERQGQSEGSIARRVQMYKVSRALFSIHNLKHINIFQIIIKYFNIQYYETTLRTKTFVKIEQQKDVCIHKCLKIEQYRKIPCTVYGIELLGKW